MDSDRWPARPPARPGSGRRWGIIGGVAACWVLLAFATGSALSATVLLIVIGGLGAMAIAGLRAMGKTGNYPWLPRPPAAPPAEGYDAPPMSGIQHEVAPQFARAGPAPGHTEPGLDAWYGPGPDRLAADGIATVMESRLAPVPVLRLVTGSSVAETLTSGARAGRGSVELRLPDDPTVSREHARFTYSEGRWRVTNQGMNGLTLNGTPVTGERPLTDGDAIRWGSRPDALLSRVTIG